MKRIKLIGLIAALAVLHLLCSSGTVQSANPSAGKKPGKIVGVVLDANNARVVLAKIKVDGPGFKWLGETDTAGEFTVAAPAGTYRIYVYAPGFRKFESSSVKVKSGVKERVNLHLEVAAVNGLTPVENEKKP